MTEINKRDRLNQLLADAAILVAAEKNNSEESQGTFYKSISLTKTSHFVSLTFIKLFCIKNRAAKKS